MYPLTTLCPKALLPITEDTTILDLLVQNFQRVQELDEIIVVVNARQISAFHAWNQYDTVKIFVSAIENNAIECLKTVIDSIACDSILVAAADNVVFFEMQHFVDYYKRDPEKTAVMYYQEQSVDELKRTGVAQVVDGLIKEMAEKPEHPAYSHAIPPFYIIPYTQWKYIDQFLKTGIRVDSLGTFLSWYVGKEIVRAFQMPGKRLNLGDKESYLKYKDQIKHEIVDM